mmetsp:Transcript_90136/g.259911  ORF Transcript_90136/g.259911 Transcript_90136/m.259911 type:complete len:250 (+) Transcript_90136:387-1136(+)
MESEWLGLGLRRCDRQADEGVAPRGLHRVRGNISGWRQGCYLRSRRLLHCVVRRHRRAVVEVRARTAHACGPVLPRWRRGLSFRRSVADVGVRPQRRPGAVALRPVGGRRACRRGDVPGESGRRPHPLRLRVSRRRSRGHWRLGHGHSHHLGCRCMHPATAPRPLTTHRGCGGARRRPYPGHGGDPQRRLCCQALEHRDRRHVVQFRRREHGSSCTVPAGVRRRRLEHGRAVEPRHVCAKVATAWRADR